MADFLISRAQAQSALQGRGRRDTPAPVEGEERLFPSPSPRDYGLGGPSILETPEARPAGEPVATEPRRGPAAPPPPAAAAASPAMPGGSARIEQRRPSVIEALAGTMAPQARSPLTQALLGHGMANNPVGMDPLGRQRMRAAFTLGTPTQQAAAGSYLRGGAGDDAQRQQNRLSQGVNLEAQRRSQNEMRQQNLVGSIADLIDVRGGKPVKNELLGDYYGMVVDMQKRYEDPKNEYGSAANDMVVERAGRMMRDLRRSDSNLDQLVLGGPLGWASDRMFSWFSTPRQEARRELQEAFLENLDKYFPGNISQQEIKEAKESVPRWTDNPEAWATWRRKIIGFKMDDLKRRISSMRSAMRAGPDSVTKYHDADDIRKVEQAYQKLSEYEQSLTEKIAEISGMNRPPETPGETVTARAKRFRHNTNRRDSATPTTIPSGPRF